jgi:hypothetical protein
MPTHPSRTHIHTSICTRRQHAPASTPAARLPPTSSDGHTRPATDRICPRHAAHCREPARGAPLPRHRIRRPSPHPPGHTLPRPCWPPARPRLPPPQAAVLSLLHTAVCPVQRGEGGVREGGGRSRRRKGICRDVRDGGVVPAVRDARARGACRCAAGRRAPDP